MSLQKRYAPQTLAEVIGQDVSVLRSLVERPEPRCLIVEGDGGNGKSCTAKAFARDLGCFDADGYMDETTGFYTIPASELDIDSARHLFTETLRYFPMYGSGWRVVVLEELDGLASKQVERYLKVAMDRQNMPARTIVVATSNDTEGMDRPFLQRFRPHLKFVSDAAFSLACQKRLREVWHDVSGGLPIPGPFPKWGWSHSLFKGDKPTFSMRSALDEMEDYLRATGVM